MRIALLIPAYNEETVIGRTLRSCWAGGFSAYHVYVYVNGSHDRTAQQARDHGAGHVIIDPVPGKARAIQKALKAWDLVERYDYVAILDADCQLTAGFKVAMERAIWRHHRPALLCGAPQSEPANWLTAYRAVEYGLAAGIFKPAQHLTRSIMVAPGCASFYRTDILARLDLSGDTLVEDMDMTVQVQRMGERVAFVPDARVLTQDPKTLSGFLGQLSRWCRGSWHVIRKHRVGRQCQPIDLETGVLVLESLAFLAWVAWCLSSPDHWEWLLYTFVAEQLFMLGVAATVAIRQSRWDVLVWFPSFWLPRMLSLGVFFWSFLVTRGKASQDLAWYSVPRY